MLKASFLIAAAALATSAQAQPLTRHFSFTGFFHEQAGQFLPDASLSGYFDSDDVNRNGVLELGEVSSFVLGDQQYVGNCGDLYICGLFAFSYIPGGALNFHTSWSTDPFGEYTAGGSVRTGVAAVSHSYTTTNTYRWTEQTRFEISPVPEPATYSMLLLGAATLALYSRSRRAPAT
jgi:hypothetical protein